jgi:signal transduction histidine kinase
MADAAQLEQAFLNLTLNAVEAMPKGGKLSIITRSVAAPRNSAAQTHVVIEFKDTGEGMTAEQTQRAFASLLKTSKSKGTGLGLAIVKRVVETHQGQVKIKSRLEHGTLIRITLPIQ